MTIVLFMGCFFKSFFKYDFNTYLLWNGWDFLYVPQLSVYLHTFIFPHLVDTGLVNMDFICSLVWKDGNPTKHHETESF